VNTSKTTRPAPGEPPKAGERRPPKEQRDEIRRQEIVVAARACVLRHGFHAASMAEISAEAHMSVGQIYRYFASKEAIVQAIVEHIVAKRLAWIGTSRGAVDLPTLLATRALSDEEADDHALLLEVTAEASRNPVVAETVRLADRRLHDKAVEAVLGDHPGMSTAEASARVEVLAVLAEGTALRRVTVRPANTRLLADLYRDVIALLLQPSAGERAGGGPPG
jgi:AcrR family transcriptional regulator